MRIKFKRKKPYSWISDKNTDIYKKHTKLKNTNNGCQKHAKCKEESDKMSKSAILYLFVAELLSVKIKNNGFKHKNSDKEIKTIQHLDDITLTLEDIESLTHEINTIEVFD